MLRACRQGRITNRDGCLLRFYLDFVAAFDFLQQHHRRVRERRPTDLVQVDIAAIAPAPAALLLAEDAVEAHDAQAPHEHVLHAPVKPRVCDPGNRRFVHGLAVAVAALTPCISTADVRGSVRLAPAVHRERMRHHELPVAAAATAARRVGDGAASDKHAEGKLRLRLEDCVVQQRLHTLVHGNMAVNSGRGRHCRSPHPAARSQAPGALGRQQSKFAPLHSGRDGG